MSNTEEIDDFTKKQKIKYKDGNNNENSNDKYINLPYNKSNVLVTEHDIEHLLLKFGIRAKVYDLEIFQIALTHKSYIEKNFEFTEDMLKECEDYPKAIPLQKKSYETLEFFGDSVADKIVRKYLCDRYPNEDEGVLTKLKTNLVDTKSFSRFARILGVTPYIVISKQVENMDNGVGRASDEFRKILEDVFEAFIGAMDRGLIDLDEYEMKTRSIDEFIEYKKNYLNPCDKLIINLLETQVDFAELFNNDTNYKNRLLQYYHKMQWGFPVYGVEAHNGPAHKRIFNMHVLDNNGNKIGFGAGKRKKDGEQYAAREALIKLGEIDEEDEIIDISTSLFI